MADEKDFEKFREKADTSLKSTSLANLEEQDVASGRECKTSGSASSISLMGDANFVMEGESDQQPDAEKGHDVSYPEIKDNAYFLEGNGSEIPHSGPNPNASAAAPAASLKSKGLNSINRNGPVVTHVSSRQLDSNSRMFAGSSYFPKSTPQSQPLKSLKEVSFSRPQIFGMRMDYSSMKVPQLGSDFRSAGLTEGYHPVRKFSSLTNQIQGPFPHNGPMRNQIQGPFPHNGPMSYRPNGRTWAGNDRFRLGEKFNRNGNLETSREPNQEKFNRNGNFETSREPNREKFNRNGNFETFREPNRGPRARGVRNPLSSSAENVEFVISLRRNKYNVQDFQTVYENAKFFVIKSYSEDDIHKSIKYGVWASTPNGNKKLDAVFYDTEAKSTESGISCPIFLFFSVNGSGQFLGLAEMIGPVDFKKDMDFWQQDKWNGFFPLKWHIIKDIPNSKLRHIILENNENRPVTYTRDTQEIGLKQGLEMLTIFKSYTAITSMLDDFKFYEDQEKSLQARSNKAVSPHMETYGNKFPQKRFEGARKTDQASMRAQRSDSKMSMVVNLTKNLSLNSHLPKAGTGKDSMEEW